MYPHLWGFSRGKIERSHSSKGSNSASEIEILLLAAGQRLVGTEPTASRTAEIAEGFGRWLDPFLRLLLPPLF